MSVQEDYQEIRWMQAKPGSKCVIYVLSTFLKFNVLLSPSFCGLLCVLSVYFVKLEYPRGMGLGWGHFPTP